MPAGARRAVTREVTGRCAVGDAASELGITRRTLHRILAGTAAITPEMALRLGKFCGNGPDLWIRMQEAHDLWHAERRIAAELASIKTASVAAD